MVKPLDTQLASIYNLSFKLYLDFNVAIKKPNVLVITPTIITKKINPICDRLMFLNITRAPIGPYKKGLKFQNIVLISL